MKKFYAIIGLIILLSNSSFVQAQLNYYDFSPDRQMFIPNVFDADLQKDAFPVDYSIILDAVAGGWQVRIFPQSATNDVLTSGDSMVKPLNFGALIDENQTTWTSNSQNYMVLRHAGTTSYGDWADVSNKFIGLRMYKNGDYYYGYVQMSIMSGATQPTVTIHDMAIQKTPAKGLSAGQTVGMNHMIFNQSAFSQNNRQLNILTERAEKVIITDISGHQILNRLVKSNKYIDLSSYPNGIYLISIYTDKEVVTDKIMLR